MNIKHNHRSRTGASPTYSSWNAMMSRCFQPKTFSFKSYGAKGITVCDRWRTFANFLEDMGERPEGCTLGRHGDQGNYEPGNVSWQTKDEQRRCYDRNPNSKLTEEQIECCVSLLVPRAKAGSSLTNMAKDLCISRSGLTQALRRHKERAA